STKRKVDTLTCQKKTASGSWALSSVAYEACRQVATVLHAQAQAAHRTAAQAQGHFPALRLPAGKSGRPAHQPDYTWLGELLCHRRRQSMLRLYQRLGGERRCGGIRCGPVTDRVSAGRGGVDAGSMTNSGCSTTTGFATRARCRQRSRLDRSHNPWDEAGSK